MNKTLAQLKAGVTAKLVDFSKNPELHFKLLSLGLLPGDCVKVISRAPFGGPISLRHGGGSSFAIRLKDAQDISIEEVPNMATNSTNNERPSESH